MQVENYRGVFDSTVGFGARPALLVVDGGAPQVRAALQALHDWAAAQDRLPLAHTCARLAACNPAGPAPTTSRWCASARASQDAASADAAAPIEASE